MGLRLQHLLLLLLAVFGSFVRVNCQEETAQSRITAPLRNKDSTVIDGSGTEHFVGSVNPKIGTGEWRPASNRVPVTTVAILTLAMAAATGLGALPFFFVELDSQWSGICNGMAAGVMLAASFDLIQEGQDHGSGSWVVFGILTGGIFIWLCKQVITFAYLTFCNGEGQNCCLYCKGSGIVSGINHYNCPCN